MCLWLGLFLWAQIKAEKHNIVLKNNFSFRGRLSPVPSELEQAVIKKRRGG
jgi:hypothetical protein